MSRLILPGLHGQEPTMVCTVPTGDGEVCGKRFYPGEERAWERHVGACARAHEAEIAAVSLKRRMPVFDDDTWNPDVAAHMRKVGARMKAEGRLKMHPNERIENE